MATTIVSPELKAAMKQLRLGKMLPTLAERIALAKKNNLPIEELLTTIFVDEVERRRSTASTRRAEEAGLDPDMVLERWDKSANVTLDHRTLNELLTLRFIENHQNVVVLGPVGVGKTFVANALGHVACRSGFNVRFYRADSMLRKLKQSRLDNSREALMIELTTIDLLIIDDFALEPMSREESRDMYQLFVERNARAATIVTSNRDTAEWLAFFDDTLLAQSAVDRFKNNAYDFIIDGESYRPRLKPSVDEASPAPEEPVVKKAVIRRKKVKANHR